MIDDQEQAQRLLVLLKRHLPFEIVLDPRLVRHLRSQSPPIEVQARLPVSEIHYAGDAGGIVCRLDRGENNDALFVSLTHLIVPPSHPAAAEAARYQKRRNKRLRKLAGA
jgi:hypothetical protein